MWHSFASPGEDMFGSETFDRPWLEPGLDPLAAGRAKLDAAFEFLAKLGVPFFCFHDRDIAPEGRTFAETRARLEAMVDYAGEHMARTGVRLLWGTANLFSHPRYAARRRHEPGPRSLRRCSGPGEAHARGDEAARRRQLRPVGWLARTVESLTRTRAADLIRRAPATTPR
jgi:hypothetical protein